MTWLFKQLALFGKRIERNTVFYFLLKCNSIYCLMFGFLNFWNDSHDDSVMTDLWFLLETLLVKKKLSSEAADIETLYFDYKEKSKDSSTFITFLVVVYREVYVCTFVVNMNEERQSRKKSLNESSPLFSCLSMILRFEWRKPRKLTNNKNREWATTAVTEGSNNKLDRELRQEFFSRNRAD